MRDPRIDPQPGDMVRKPPGSGNKTELVRFVVRVKDGIVEFDTPKPCRLSCFISKWRKWCDASVTVSKWY